MRFLGGLREVLSRFTSKPKSGQVPSELRLADDLRRSGLFDPDWYLSQLDTPPSHGEDPIQHYVRTGAHSGISPQPCFVPEWYLSQPDCPKNLEGEAFSTMSAAERPAEFRRILYSTPSSISAIIGTPRLTREAHSAITFIVAGLLTRAPAPASIRPPTAGRLATSPAHRWLTSLDGSAPCCGRLGAMSTSLAHRSISTPRRRQPLFRNVLQRYRVLAEAAPKVSIVVPTKDRAAGVVQAIRSVIEQTYLHWELIVVDDGSTDSTSEAVRTISGRLPYSDDPS